MKILFLHGLQSSPGGVKPTYLASHGHEVINPALPDEDFEAAVRIAQAEFDQHQPDAVVGSSRGGAVAMNLEAGTTPVVLLCPAWKRWGTVQQVKPGTFILHSPADDVIPFSDSEELVRNSGLPASALIEVGNDHRLADPKSLAAMLGACDNATKLKGSTPTRRRLSRNVPEEERRDAEKTGELVRKKLMAIMDLQADIDALMRDKHPTPFGSQKWQYASLEALQRLVAMTAIQFILFEPVDWVKGNDEFKVTAEKLLTQLGAQVKTLKTKKSDW